MMEQSWITPLQGRPSRIRLSSRVILSLTLEVALALVLAAATRASGQTLTPAGRYVIPLEPLAPYGRLSAPVNFGYRCTIVDAAAVLNYYGVQVPQASLASKLGELAGNSGQTHGIPWWMYVSWPGQQSQLDQAIEQTSAQEGRSVVAETTLGLNFDRVVATIAAGHPVILNVFRAPDGTPNHSLLAYGFNTHAGNALLYAIDPNTQESYWIGPNTYWSWTVTSTYIRPAGRGAS